MDRWLTGTQAARLRAAEDPLVVDLGFGASPVTTLELARRLRTVRADVEVVGVEIEPDRVAAAQAIAGPGLSFRRGGFELPVDGRRPVLVRAANVLRQYPEADALHAWSRLCARLAPDGLLLEGTCSELGRRATWVGLTAGGPQTLTLATRFADLDRPSSLAERLPKALIHHNVPGEPVHAYLAALDAAWDVAAPYAAYSVRQRWMRTVRLVRAGGWPVLDRESRWRLGEVTTAWRAVAPR